MKKIAKICSLCKEMNNEYDNCQICDETICKECNKGDLFINCDYCGEKVCRNCMKICSCVFLVTGESKNQYDKKNNGKSEIIAFLCKKCCTEHKDLSYIRCIKCSYNSD